MVELFFLLKTISLTIFIIIIRGTLPRYRIDHVLVDSWKEWIMFILCTLLALIFSHIFFFW